MRILFGGDTAGTGFGTVTADLGRALLAQGEDVRFMSINEQPSHVPPSELPEPFRDRTATFGDSSGWLVMTDDPEIAKRTSERLEGMFRGSLFPDGWTPDAAIILGDVGSLKVSPILDFIPDGFPAFHYVPIEGVGLPPAWREVWTRIRPVATASFGAQEIGKLTGATVPVVFHGVDMASFYPVSPKHPITLRNGKELIVLRSREDCRRFLGWPKDETILFRADRHMPRKAYPSLFRSIAPVLARNPGTRLIWHCRTLDQGGDLQDERSKYPREIGERMNSTGLHDRYGGVERPILAAMYNAADLYVSNCAEGFGLTIAESLACGVPAVGLDYSAVPEVIGPAGLTVPVGGLVDNIYSHFWALPDERKFGETVERLVRNVAERRLLGAKGPYHVGEHFTWPRAAEQFAALIRAQIRQEVAA